MRFFHNIIASVTLVTRFVRTIFPQINRQLDDWAKYATWHACPELKEQALASIKSKKFHCQGGSIYSLYPNVSTVDFIALVVALQTISDYLDNLCDRAGIADECAFRQLHQAMTDALDPTAPVHDYYAFYPFTDDGGYLTELVVTCQQQIAKLPGYSLVKSELLRFASLYSDLQTYKHLDPDIRQIKMSYWLQQHSANYPSITAWEFAAATGSTLSMFILCAVASDKSLTASTVNKLSTAYFPWINGLHILLDYFIDVSEDQAGGDLNFVTYYTDQTQILSRLTLFTAQALQAAQNLPHPLFHKTVIHGLLAMYLSDPKVRSPEEQLIRKALLKTAGSYATLLYFLCKLLRLKKTL